MAKSSRKPLRFSHIRLENWRNFRSAEIELQERVFLVGPNAAGKSNFLDAFRFLQDLVVVGGGLQAAVSAKRGGVSSLRSLFARQRSDVAIEVALGDDETPRVWQYEVRFNQSPGQGPMLKSERVIHRGREILKRPRPEDLDDPQRMTQTFLEQVNVNKDFREVAEVFGSIRYLHIVPQLVREPERSVGRKNDPYGGDFLEQIASTPAKTQKARLKRIESALRVAVPQLKELELVRDPARGTPHLRGKYEHWRPQGHWQSEEVFSDGTLRLIGLLWATLETSGPLLLEEPELSLHPEVVRFLPQLLARAQRRLGKQILLSTHSLDLMQDPGIGLDEVLLLLPDKEGTSVRTAGSFPEIAALLEGGLSLAEALLPATRPAGAEQLALFAES